MALLLASPALGQEITWTGGGPFSFGLVDAQLVSTATSPCFGTDVTATFTDTDGIAQPPFPNEISGFVRAAQDGTQVGQRTTLVVDFAGIPHSLGAYRIFDVDAAGFVDIIEVEASNGGTPVNVEMVCPDADGRCSYDITGNGTPVATATGVSNNGPAFADNGAVDIIINEPFTSLEVEYVVGPGARFQVTIFDQKFTMDCTPEAGGAKQAGTPTPAASGTPGNFDIPYTFFIENTGTSRLDNLSVIDDLATQFGSALVGIVAAPMVNNVDATNPPLANGGYDGTGDLLIGSDADILDPGESFEITLTVEVDPDAGGAPLPLSNQATVSGTDPQDIVSSDGTDSGSDPGGNNPGEPGDTGGTDDPTPLTISLLGVAKTAGTAVPAASGVMGNFDVPYTFTVQNGGTERLSDLSLVDDLAAQFGGAFVGVTVPPAVINVDASSPPAPNTGYAGMGDLLLGTVSDRLESGESFQVTVTVEVDPDAPGANLPLENQATGGGDDPAGNTITDDSDSGSDPIGPNPGEPGDTGGTDDPTPLSLAAIGAAKQAGALVPAASGTVGNFDVPYTFVVQNAGTETLSNLRLLDDLTTQLGSALIGITTAPAVVNVDATSPPLPNTAYTGSGDLLIGAPTDALEAGQSFQVTLTIEIDPDAAGAPLPLANQATAGGLDTNASPVTDTTDSGTDPTGSNPGEPGDTGGTDDPTPLTVSLIGVAKAAGTPTPAASGVMGNFDVPYTFTVQNTGTETLSNLSLIEELATQFGSALVGVTAGPTVVNVDATSPPGANGGYVGSGDLLLGAPSDALEAGQSFQVTLTVEVDPDAAGAPSPLENQATAGGDDPTGTTVTDDSDSGSDPGGNNPGEPGDSGGPDDPTPLSLPAIGVAKQAGTPAPAASGTVGNVDVPYTFTVQNAGTETLNSLSLVDELATEFGSALIDVTVAPAIVNVDATSPPAPNGAYTGAGDLLIGDPADALEPGQSFQVVLTIEVDPDAAGAPRPLTNQATASGDDPAGMTATDDSDSGTDPNGNNPGEPGDTGGFDDPTPLTVSQIGVAKEAGTPVMAGSGVMGNFDVPYTFTVQNTGTERLNNLSLIEELTTQFGSALVGITTAPAVVNVDASSPPNPNSGYTGSGDLLLGSGSDNLNAGQSFQVTLTVELDPDAPAAPSPLENQATAGGDDPAGTNVTDDSDSGSDPSGNNPGEPGDTGGPNDPTPLSLPAIGVAKQVGTLVPATSGTVGNFDVPYTFVVQNTGTETLTNLTLVDELVTEFGSAFIGVTAPPAVVNVDATSPPAANTAYAGSGDLLIGAPADMVEPGQSFQVTLTVEVDPDAAGAPRPLANQAMATGQDPAGMTATDDSDSGTDPIGSNPGEPGDSGGSDDPTPLAISQIGVAKAADVPAPAASGVAGNFDVPYTFTVQNTGTERLTNLSLLEDLTTQFGSALIGVTVAPAVVNVDASNPPIANGGYDGTGDLLLGSGSDNLNAGQSFQVTLTVEIDPDAAGAPSPLENQATAGGDDPTGTNVTDDSDSGTDPGGNNPGEPGDTGGLDDPTPLLLPAIGVAKAAATPTPAGSGTPGNFDVPYTLVVQNVGSVNLVNLSLIDDIVDQLGPAFVAVASPPVVVNVDATSPPPPNPDYTGVTPENDLIDGFAGELLEPGQSFNVEVTIEIDPDATGVVLPLTNQATAGATDPDENPLSDDSDSGADPTGTNPGEPGDSGGPDDPTPVAIPLIGVAKEAGTPAPAASGVMGNFDVTYTFVVQSTGTETLNNLTLVDDLSAQLGSGLIGVVTAPAVTNVDATSPPNANTGYDGTGDLLLGAPTDAVETGQSFIVTVTVELDPDAAGAPSPLENQAAAGGDDPAGTNVTDDSDSGSDPTGNNPGEPGDTGGPDDPTPLALPAIGTAKQAGTPVPAASGTLGNFDVPYAFTVQNTGTETLSSLTLTDDLTTELGSAFVGVTVAPAVVNVDATSPPAANGAYAGTGDLLAGDPADALEPGQSFTVTVTVEVDPDAAGAPLPLANQATATGDDPAGTTASDDSDSGTDPVGSNPGEPGDTGGTDDPTPLTLSQIGVAKAADTPSPAASGVMGNFDVPYTFTVQNLGTEPLSSLTLIDDLTTQFGGAFVAVAVAPAVVNVDASTPPIASGGYDGTGDLLAGSPADLLESGQSFQVTATIEVDPDAPGAVLPLANQGTAGGDDPSGATVTDDSDSGSDPAGNNPDEPGDTGGSDDPTPIELPAIGVAKQAGTPVPATSGGVGNFDIPFTLVVANTGTQPLTSLSLVDDLTTQLGAAFIDVVSVPVVINVDATTPPAGNFGYTGQAPDDDLLLGVPSDLLDVGQSFQVEVTIEIDPDAAGAILPIANQATAGAEDPDGGLVSDDSDSGTDPTGTNPGEPGDTGGTDDPTEVTIPQIGVAKAASKPVPAASGVMGNFDVEFTFVVQNTGTEILTDVSLLEDLSLQYGGALVAVIVAPELTKSDLTEDPPVNAAYDGTTANADLLDPSLGSVIEPGQRFSVTVSVELDPDAPGAITPLENQATASANDPSGDPVTDLSDSGSDPTGSNPGAPGDAGTPDDPTPLSLPAIGVAKQAGTPVAAASGSVGNLDVPYTFVVQNTGTEALNTLSLIDDLSSELGSAFVAVTVAPAVVNVDATTPPAANSAYDGTGANSDLLVGDPADSLEPGQSFQVTVTVELDPDAVGAPRPLANQATASGIDAAGGLATDTSDSGTDPVGTNPGEPGDTGDTDDPTPFTFAQIHVAKAASTPVDAGNGEFDVDYTFVVQNTGTEPLTSLRLVDDISTEFGGAFVSVTTPPVVTNVDATSPPAENGAYDGTGNLLIGAPGDLLEPNQSFSVTVTIRIDPDAPGGNLPLLNQGVASGDDPTGATVSDDSDSGSDPQSTNPGADGDTGGSNDPTPTSIASIGTAKQVTAFDPAASGTVGNFDVEYTFVVQSTGTQTLTNLSLLDDLSSQLGSTFVGVVTAPAVTNVDATSPPLANGAYTGIAPDDDLLVGAGTDAVDPGQSFTVSVTIELDPDAADAPLPLSNQGTASGDDPDGTNVQDLSDSGADPAGNNPGEPGDTGGSDDPTPLTVAQLGVAKEAGTAVPAASGTLGNVDVPYTFVVQNTGTEPLTLLSLVDDLTAGDQLGSAFVAVSVAPAVVNVDATSPPVANDAYDGTDDLLVSDAADRLESGQSFTVTLTIEVDPDAPGVPSPLMNQATAAAEDPNVPGVPVTDDSDSGTDPGGDNPDAPGDQGTPDDPTPLSLPAIGVAKAAGTPAPAASGVAGNVDVEYTFVVQNTGMEPLSSLSLTDDLTADLGGAFVAVVVAPVVTNVDATSPPVPNIAYDGTATNADLLVGDPADNVEAGQSFSVTVTVEIDPDGGTLPLDNQAEAMGTDPMGLVTTDISDSGADPAGNNPGEPGDTGGADDPTPFSITQIAVAKSAGTPTPVGGGLFDVQYTFVVENTGTETMRNLTLVDDLAAQFGAGVIDSVPVPPIVTNVDATSPPGADPDYAGAPPEIDLITGAPADRLESGQSFSVTVTVRIAPTAPDAILPLANQATAGGDDIAGTTVTDTSDSGSAPDSNNPGENGDTGGSDDPTPTTVSAIGIAKEASTPTPAASNTFGNFDVEYTFVVRNNGTQNLLNLSLVDNLAAQLGGAFVDVVAAPVVENVNATSPPAENPAYDGTSANDDLLLGGPDDLVESGQSFEVTVTIEIDPDAAGAVLPLANQATASGQNGNGVSVQDQSDSGTDPVGDNPGAPGDNGTEDDPTPLMISLIGVTKAAGDPVAAVSGAPGNFDLPFTFVVQNTGTEPLSNLSLTDDLVAQLGSTFIGVTVAPEVINIDATSPPPANPDFTGGTAPPGDELLLGSPADLLESMQSFQVTVTIEIDPNAAGAPSPLENQATVSATDPTDAVITDDSDSGSDPMGTNPDEPGDTGGPDDPTPLMLPGIGVAKSVVDLVPNGDNFDVEFLFVIENTGTETLSSLSLIDDLATQLGGAFVAVAAAPTVSNIDATGPPLPNDAYDGTSDLLLGDPADVLEPGQMFEVSITVELDPDAPDAVPPLANQATAAGTDSDGIVATDLSDSGTDPMGTNPDEPGDTGTGDDPTLIEIDDLSVTKTDELTDDADGSGDLSGSDTITYKIEIFNSGTTEQTDVVFEDAPDANTSLVVGSVVSDPSGVVVRGNNPDDAAVRVAVGTIASGETATVTFEATVNELLTPAPGNEVIYASVGLGPTDLYEVDPATLEATFRMEFTSDVQVHALATCGSIDFVYGIGKATRKLIFVDLAVEPPTETVIADLSDSIPNPIVQLACDSNGILYFSDEFTEELFRIDPAACPACDAELVGVIETTPGAADVNTSGSDLVFTKTNRLYLATNLPTPSLYRVDPNTAIARFVGDIATPEFNFGLTALEDGRLVITSNDSHLYEVDPTTAEITDLGQPAELGVPVTLQWGDAAGAVPSGVGTLSNQGLVSTAALGSQPTDDPDTDLANDPTLTIVGTRPFVDAAKSFALFDDADASGDVTAGDTLEYTVTISNFGTAEDTAVFFRDVPGAGSVLIEGSVTTTTGTVVQGNNPGDVVVEVDLGTLAAGASEVVTYQVTVDGTEDLIENQGTVTSDDVPLGIVTDDPVTEAIDDPTRTALADFVLIETLKVDLLAEDRDGDGEVTSRDTLRYTITLRNVSSTEVTSLSFTDTPDPATTLVIGSVVTPTGTVNAGNTPGDTSIDVTIPTLRPEEVATISFDVTVDAILPGSTLSNQGQVIGTVVNQPTDDPATLELDDPTITNLGPAPNLAVTKEDGGARPIPGQVLVYTLNYTNAGGKDAANVVLTETVPEATTYDDASSTPGWSCADGDPAGSVCTFSLGDVPVGTVDSVDFGVVIDDPFPVDANSVENTVTIADDGTAGADEAPDDNVDICTTPVLVEADLAVEKIAVFDPVMAGEVQSYEITVTNNGPNAATGVELVDVLPTDALLISADPSCVDDTGTLTCDLGGLLPGATAEITINVLVDHFFEGTLTNEASVSGAEDDPDTGNNAVSVDSEVAPRMIIKSIADVDGDGTADVAVLFRDAGVTQVFVKNAVTGRPIQTIALDAEFFPVDLEVMPNFAGGAADELAVLARDPAAGTTRVFVHDAGDASLLAARGYSPAYLPCDLEIVPDLDGSGIDELAVLERNPDTGVARSQIKDPLVAGAISNVFPPAGFFPVDLEVMDVDLTGTVVEIAVLATETVTGGVITSVHDAATGALSTTVAFPTWVAQELEILADTDGGGAPELALLTHEPFDDKGRVITKDRATAAEISRITLPLGQVARDMEVVPNFADTDADELAIALTRNSDGRARIFTKDPVSRATLSRLQQSAAEVPYDIDVVPDVGDSTADEIATLGSDGTPLVTIRDAQTGGLIRFVFVP